MLTPIRVRGKNKRTKRVKDEHSNSTSSGNVPNPSPRRRGRPRKTLRDQSSVGDKQLRPTSSILLPTKLATRASTLSRLERLPVEILQRILLYSLNLALPQSSPHLDRVLASDHVRRELVLRTFDLTAKEDDSEARGLAQSALLRQKWLTWSLWRKCHPKLGRCAAATLREFVFEHMPHIQEPRVAEMELACANFSYFDPGALCWNLGPGTGMFCNDATIEGDVKNMYSWEFEDGPEFMLGFSSWSAFFIMVIRSVEGHREDARLPATTRGVHYFRTCSSNLVIPEKLLHGPWTQEKGNFLMDLLCVYANIDWINSTSGEVASKGLEDAIREDNLHAARALIFTDEGPRNQPHSISDIFQPFATEKQTCPTSFDPQGPWLCSSASFWGTRSTVGVVPTTEHLRIAVFEMHCNPYVIWAMLYSAQKWAIDWDDPAIIQWALADKAKDYVPSPPLSVTKGEYLLRVLESCREVQKGRQRLTE